MRMTGYELTIQRSIMNSPKTTDLKPTEPNVTRPTFTLPIFPLAIYLLPGGITRLRIFEQRYLQMVRDANKTDGFAICYFNQASKLGLSDWASWVDIVDFEMGSDGVLVIDVKCRALVNINASSYDDKNLLQGSVSIKHHWSEEGDNIVHRTDNGLTSELERFFNENKELSNLYHDKFNHNINWVCARWLELIPVSFANKKHFADTNNLNDAIKFLSNIIVDTSDEKNNSLIIK